MKFHKIPLPHDKKSGSLALATFFLDELYTFSAGVCFLMFVILVNIWPETKKERSYKWAILNVLPSFFYLIEFAPRESSGTAEQYLILKKMLTTSGLILS